MEGAGAGAGLGCAQGQAVGPKVLGVQSWGHRAGTAVQKRPCGRLAAGYLTGVLGHALPGRLSN